ncbi:MAG: hypothetical protein R3B09_20175 [Nannocystaceae bacterium]
MNGVDLLPWIVCGLSLSLSVALGSLALHARRLGDAEGERRILRDVLAHHRARCGGPRATPPLAGEPEIRPPPVRPAGVSMAEWRRRQGLEPEEGEEG